MAVRPQKITTVKDTATDITPAFSGKGSEGRLAVAVEGGLCNRMRAVLSAAGVAGKTGCSVRVAWSDKAECGCRFEDVFMPVTAGVSGIPENFSVVPASFLDIPAARRNLWLPALLRRAYYKAQRRHFNASGNDDVLSLLSRYGSVYVSTCYEFFDAPLKMGEFFRPSPRVREITERLAATFGVNTVGMHIRAGDNAMSLKYSPLSLFIEKAREELSLRSDTVFFLATDSMEAKSEFVRLFGKKVIVSDGILSRSTVEGMQYAAADLFALALTTRIYGSYYSSFSGTAAEIGNIPIDILKVQSSSRN